MSEKSLSELFAEAHRACPCAHPSRGHWCCQPIGAKTSRLPCCHCEDGKRDCRWPGHAALDAIAERQHAYAVHESPQAYEFVVCHCDEDCAALRTACKEGR